MTRWEYRVCAVRSESDLNQLGAQGWELVSAVYDTDRMIVALYFKRPAV
ncbi:hypothetical protein GCM10023194_58730 [Planotetraspora phitsanulokensis]|uniref:DUF4177 domain-containing protein n=1 Tax=Planotetraspora phitsanulokensis TaxID=575192 RepID=A0A8J3UDB2_9ACTN|nr:hypothetical protein [Planotetraspora phitsanulokensis]GII40334.1 hypothetical protein Pph01_53370 [Planotetraspora phitsanulokensis]